MSRDRALAAARALAQELEALKVPVSIELQQGRPGTPNGRWFDARFIGTMGHHTVSRRSMGMTPTLALIKRGRPDVPGPLCNGYLGFDGRARIICMGWANHPGAGGPVTLPGGRIPKDGARPYLFGWEIEGGLDERDWTPEFRVLMGKVHAATLRWLKRDERSHLEHKSWTNRKIDRLGYSLTGARNELKPHLSTSTPKPPDPPTPEDDMPYRDWPAADKKALADDLATAILSRENSTSGRNIMFHTRRGDNATAHFTSLVSGNDVSLATAARHAQQKSTEARNVLVPRITSPISGNDIALRSMWSYQYRDINRARDEAKSGFKAVQGEIAQVKATLAAQGALLKQVLERPGQPIDMKAIESAALAGAQEALRELDVRIEIAAADEPEIPDPVVDVITDGSDEPQLDEDDA